MSPLGTDPVRFLRRNLFTLDPSLDNPPQEVIRSDRTVLVKLCDVTAEYGRVLRSRNRKGLAARMPKALTKWWVKPTRIFKVLPAKEGETDAFPAYVCPFVFNAACFKVLAADADVMFTGDMDGCTFGVGIPTTDGTVYVGHANAQKDARPELADPTGAQRKSQKNYLTDEGLTPLVDPDVYRLPAVDSPDPARPGKWLRREYKAVTIGVRVNGDWEFYYQHQLMDGTDWREGIGLVKVR